MTRVALAATLALVAGCSSALRWDASGGYTVQAGDTLYSIAFRNGLDYHDVAAWNGIGPPYRIDVGQRLRLRPPTAGSTVAGSTPPQRSTAPKPVAPAGRLDWRWPVDGAVLSAFGANGAFDKGIDIAGERGAPIAAAAAGRVVYAGSGLVGFGKVIIVKHDERWLSAYAYVDSFAVKEGDAVQRGQRIATLGLGPGRRPMLHFEIRLDGRAVDPMPLLPRR